MTGALVRPYSSTYKGPTKALLRLIEGSTQSALPLFKTFFQEHFSALLLITWCPKQCHRKGLVLPKIPCKSDSITRTRVKAPRLLYKGCTQPSLRFLQGSTQVSLHISHGLFINTFSVWLLLMWYLSSAVIVSKSSSETRISDSAFLW